jgi:hypothetical protein
VLKNPATLLQLCYKIVNKETILNKNAISKSKDYTKSKYNIQKISFIVALIVNLSFFLARCLIVSHELQGKVIKVATYS